MRQHRHPHNEIWNLVKVKPSQELNLFLACIILVFCHEVRKQQIKILSKQTNKLALISLISSLSLSLLLKKMWIWLLLNDECILCRHLTDESGGGALSNPEAELPLLPLPQLSFRTGGDEHWVLVYQGLMKNLETHRRRMYTWVWLSGFLTMSQVQDVLLKK